METVEREGIQEIISTLGYSPQLFCTEDLVLHLSHQKDKMGQDHIFVWQI